MWGGGKWKTFRLWSSEIQVVSFPGRCDLKPHRRPRTAVCSLKTQLRDSTCGTDRHGLNHIVPRSSDFSLNLGNNLPELKSASYEPAYILVLIAKKIKLHCSHQDGGGMPQLQQRGDCHTHRNSMGQVAVLG